MTYVLNCNDEPVTFASHDHLSNLIPKGQLPTWESAAVWIPLHVSYTFMLRSMTGSTQVEMPDLPNPLPFKQTDSGDWSVIVADLRYAIRQADSENPD